jgi:threonine/homoserine/homoserine lactone efflux protein
MQAYYAPRGPFPPGKDEMINYAFLAAATVLAITPGPAIAYVVARTACGGKAEGVASCVGTALGGLVHVIAAACGLSLLVARFSIAFAALKYAGAAYLIYLGMKALLFSRHVAALELAPAGPFRALRDGALVEALNVKTALFFLAFLPQFISRDASIAPQMVLLGVVCVLLNTAADLVAVSLANILLHAGPTLRTRRRRLQQTSGISMLALGLYMGLSKQQ